MLQLLQTCLVQRRQLAAHCINVRRQLNASHADIGDVSTGIDDVTAAATELMTSSHAVHDGVNMTTWNAVELSLVVMHVTQLEDNAISVNNQVPSPRYHSQIGVIQSLLT